MNYIILFICLCYLRIQLITSFCETENIACGKTAVQSSVFYYDAGNKAGHATDGSFENFQTSCTHTDHGDLNPWLMVDLVNEYLLEKVILLGRNMAIERLDYFIVELLNMDSTTSPELYNMCGQWSGKALLNYNMTVYCSYQHQPARKIIVSQGPGGPGYLTICELQAFGTNLTSFCPVGLYGIGCQNVCHCLNGLPCSVDGVCEAGCHQDWSGDHCNQFKDVNSYTSIGCYNDSFNLTTKQTIMKDLTSAKCVQYCFEIGFYFAATHNGVECHCGTKTGKYRENRTDIFNCAVPCSGNTFEMCGGNTSFKNVYGVCPPNYFGYKCRFKCHCSLESICRYPDGICVLKHNTGDLIGNCKKSPDLQYSDWLSPTCHIRDCDINKTCNINGLCKNFVGPNKIWFCECRNIGYINTEESCTDIDECTTANNCNKESEHCINTIGSYNCLCKNGDNSTCEEHTPKNYLFIVGPVFGFIACSALILAYFMIIKKNKLLQLMGNSGLENDTYEILKTPNVMMKQCERTLED